MVRTIEKSEHQISCILMTYNEIKNISYIKSNIKVMENHQVIVLDGGSNDGTIEALKKIENIDLIVEPNTGRLYRTLIGIKKAKNQICLIFVADDDFIGVDINLLASELINSKTQGLNIMKRHRENYSYLEKWWIAYTDIVNSSYSNTRILGRPCITYKKLHENIDNVPKHDFAGDDTYLAKEFDKLKYEINYGVSNQTIFRKSTETNFKSIVRRHLEYGIGDRKSSHKLSDYIDYLFHYIIRISIYRSILMIKNRKYIFAPMTFFLGFVRLFGFLFC